MTWPKYKYLLTYRYSLIIHDLTVEFCRTFLGTLGHLGQIPQRRTIDQMVQAARSGKQNIVEGVGQSRTSKVAAFRRRAVVLTDLGNLGNLGDLREKPKLPKDPQTAANLMLTLCHMETYLLSRQIAKAEETFVKGGGYTEELFQKRLRSRMQG